jgi:hypothetical protein
MSYDDTTLREVLSEIIEKWDGNNIAELCDHVFMISSMFKHETWKSEREYRFFFHHKRNEILKNPHYMTRERQGEAVSYLDVPIQNWDQPIDFPIYQIRLGPAAPPYLAAQLSDFIFSKSLPIRRASILLSTSPVPAAARRGSPGNWPGC